MRQLVIDIPVINSAFLEPGKHFKFSDDGITDEIVESRRPSAYFIPVARPKKKGKQLELGTEWTDDRRRENVSECVARSDKQYLANKLCEATKAANPELDRRALKMATGSGSSALTACGRDVEIRMSREPRSGGSSRMRALGRERSTPCSR